MAKRLTALGVSLCLSGFAASVSGADPTAPLHALMVTGGCCHDYENQKTLLMQGISARANVSWTIVHEGGTSRDHKVSIYTNSQWAAGYDVVVHNECFGGVTDVAFIEGIAAAHHAGVPAVMVHCSIHSYRNAQTDEWRKCLGVSSYSHESLRGLLVTNLFPGHPVMRGFPATWQDPPDELYKIDVVWPNAVPLAQVYGTETLRNHAVVWVNTYGNGRVFGTTLGHGNDTVGAGVFLDLVTRGLLWACGRLDEPSVFRIVDTRHLTDSTEVTWASVPGWRYAAETAPDVTGPWDPVAGGPITATHVMSTLTIPNQGARQRFVRVQMME